MLAFYFGYRRCGVLGLLLILIFGAFVVAVMLFACFVLLRWLFAGWFDYSINCFGVMSW